ncbi:MAG: hypothetical protein ACE5JK_03830 [Candidatus Omnitrophota bacterium]
MKKVIFAGLIIAASVVIVIAFFMPWANVDASVTGISKELTKAAEGPLEKTPFAGKFLKKLDEVTTAIGEIGDVEIKTTVRGNQIPAMVNNKTSKVAISLAQVFFKDTEGLDKKVYLVYLLPLFGIICASLAVLGLKNKIYVLIATVIGGAISITGLYNLYTMDIPSLVVKISIQKGLWHTMYAYLAICLAGIAWLVLDRKRS